MNVNEISNKEHTNKEVNWRFIRLCASAHATRDNFWQIAEIKEAIGREDTVYAAQLWEELDNNAYFALKLAPLKGGIFTTTEIKYLDEHANKSVSVDDLDAYNKFLRESVWR